MFSGECRELGVVIADQTRWPAVVRRGSSQLLSHRRVGKVAGYVEVGDFASNAARMTV